MENDAEIRGSGPPLRLVIPTYRRADRLRVLLETIAVRPDVRRSGAKILVVDNDPQGSARSVAVPFGVDYVVEERPGIAAARQRGLDMSGDFDAVIMLDDDLVPADEWLDPLEQAWQATRAAVVMGYVDYRWPQGTPEWISTGGFMRRVLHATGTELQGLSTGNVLIDIAQTRALGARFDASLGLAGGEDTRFGDDVLARGGSIVFCAESVAIDYIPRDRATRPFVLRRTISHGKARSAMRLDASPRGAARLIVRTRLFVGAVARIVVFALAEAWSGMIGRRSARAVYRRRRWFGYGTLLGSLGSRGAEYARD